MTVLVGVLCKDGVVVGSDSSRTLASTAGLTIEQSVKKTFTVGQDIIFAITGQLGLGQRLEFTVQSIRQQTSDWHTKMPVEIATCISRNMLLNMQHTFLGPGGLGALAAFVCQDGFHLCEFAEANFQPEMKTADAWFVSMGSGQLITDPFFGLLRRTLFRHSQPILAEGILAAYWALHNAIDLNTGGIDGPVQLAVLRRSASGGPFEARLLGADQLDEHCSAVKDVEDHLTKYRKQLAQLPATPLPTPPQT